MEEASPCTALRCQKCRRTRDDPAHVFGCDCPCNAPARPGVLADFTRALAERGLPADATLEDLLRHERGQAGMQAVLELMTDLYKKANAHEASGNVYAARTIRSAVDGGG